MSAKAKTTPSATAAERIADCRRRLGEIEARIDNIGFAGPSPAVVAARVERVLQEVQDTASRRSPAYVLGARIDDTRQALEIATELRELSAVEFAALTDPDRLRLWLLNEAEAFAATSPERLDLETAIAERERLEAERETLEIAEEIAIREIETTGASFDRRGDASAAVVLAPDDELVQ